MLQTKTFNQHTAILLNKDVNEWIISADALLNDGPKTLFKVVSITFSHFDNTEHYADVVYESTVWPV